MSPKKKKNVQSATEQKPENAKPTEEVKPSPEPVQVVTQEAPATPSPKEVPQKLIEIPPIDEDTKRMLAKAGVNWDNVTQAFEKVNIWAESVDARFGVILEKMPTEKGIADELIKRAEEKQKQMAASTPATSSGKEGGGIGMGQILGVIDKVMGSTSSSPLQDKMEKVMGAILDKSLESITKGDRFSQLLEEELMKSKAKAMAAVVTQTS